MKIINDITTWSGARSSRRGLKCVLTSPVDVAGEIELRPGEIGELIISGWHVNTYQVLLMQLAVLFKGWSLLHTPYLEL